MFFYWKKKCKVAQEQAEAWRKIATGRDERIEELLKQIRDLHDGRAEMYNYCYELKHDKDELLARCQELKTKLDFVTEQRDYYYNLLEGTGGVHVGDVIVKETE